MSYMSDLEARLGTLLAGIAEGERLILIREIKAIALESYRNGQKAGAPNQKPRPSAKPAPARHYRR